MVVFLGRRGVQVASDAVMSVYTRVWLHSTTYKAEDGERTLSVRTVFECTGYYTNVVHVVLTCQYIYTVVYYIYTLGYMYGMHTRIRACTMYCPGSK